MSVTMNGREENGRVTPSEWWWMVEEAAGMSGVGEQFLFFVLNIFKHVSVQQ